MSGMKASSVRYDRRARSVVTKPRGRVHKILSTARAVTPPHVIYKWKKQPERWGDYSEERVSHSDW